MGEPTEDIILIVLFIVFLIAANISNYRDSYITGRRKWWYFWLCLVLSITFIIMGLFPTLFI